MLVAPAAPDGRAIAGYQFGVADEETASNERTPLENLPETDANGKATLPGQRSPRRRHRPVRWRRRSSSAWSETGGRAVERKLTLPVAPQAAMIGVKPLFADKSVGEGEKAEFDVVFVAPDGKQLRARRPALRTAEDRVALSMVSPATVLGVRAGQVDQARRRRRSDARRRQAGAHLAAAAAGPLSPRRQVDRCRRPGHLGAVRRRLVFRRQRRHAGPAGDRARQAGVRVRRHHDGRRSTRAPPASSRSTCSATGC